MMTQAIRLASLPCLWLVVVLSAGCVASSGSTASLYLLDREPATITPNTETDDMRGTLALADIQLAGFLRRGGIVYQTDANRIVIAGSNRWAEPLADQLLRRLRRMLEQALPRMTVQPAGDASDADYKLLMHVERFQGQYDGTARISGHWRLLDDAAHTIDRSDFSRATALTDDGYAALVQALGEGWAAVEKNLADAVSAALQRHIAASGSVSAQ